MTIKFNCPNCNELIAFDSKHCGKRARCINCGQLFIIPSKDDEKPKKIKVEVEKGEPIPGFYRAVFINSYKLFTTSENVTGLVFVLIAAGFKFFVATFVYSITFQFNRTITLVFPIGWILNIATWGLLFWYYMKVIYSTAFEVEKLPDINLGGLNEFTWHVIKSIYLFFIVLFVVELPYLIVSMISKKMGYEWPVLLYFLMLGGLFLFPMAILTMAVGKDITLLRHDYFLIPIYRAFMPYLVTVVLLSAAGILQTQTNQYSNQGFATIIGDLSLNLVVQVVAIVAMRSIGLFYRHYNCHLRW